MSILAELLRAERRSLAPYAQHAADTRGRAHPEAAHSFRTDYQRDGARVIHSRAFRRLEFKTQVFLSGSGDHLRNRLTHTIEVASISRTIARALRLNEDLAEAVALAHDLGHPPFGHSGEATLDRLMGDHGGFDHNVQSLRVVEVLEQKYPGVPGLNLSHEVIEGLRKHDRRLRTPDGWVYRQPSLGGQIANIADEITYYSHDLDDGLDAGLLKPGQLDAVRLWRETRETALARHPELAGKLLRTYVIRCLIDREVEDVIIASRERIAAAGVRTPDDVRLCAKPLIGPGEALRPANRELRKFLYQNIYFHPRLAVMNRRACARLERVFRAYERRPELLGSAAAGRVEAQGLHRTLCDYIAGMTDPYLIAEDERLRGSSRSRPPRTAARVTSTARRPH